MENIWFVGYGVIKAPKYFFPKFHHKKSKSGYQKWFSKKIFSKILICKKLNNNFYICI